MDKKDAFKIVLDDLMNCPMFCGKYDAVHGKDDFMYGISTVMEAIAVRIDDETYEKFSEMFLNNMCECQEYARELKHAPSYLAGTGRRK